MELKKRYQNFSSLERGRVAAIVLLAALTLVRIWLFLKTPLRLQADAVCDDMLMVKYALNMLNLEWLGPYEELTLVKAPAFSVLLAMGYVLNLPYAFMLLACYILACVLFARSIYALTKSRSLSLLCYAYLLFSPSMMHEENVQKVYRGGYIVVFALLVVAAYVGMYANRNRAQGMRGWAVLGAVSLPIFWYLKEDSIWIAPFTVVAGLITICLILRQKDVEKKTLRIVLVLVPFASLLVAGISYRTLNMVHYGVFMTTDRQEGSFHDVMSDILQIKGTNEDPNIWVARDQLEAALSASPTLNRLTGGIEVLTADDGEYALAGGKTVGDFYIWRLRHKVANQGYYENGAAYMNDEYSKVHQELVEAINDGRLESHASGVRVSSLAPSFDPEGFVQYFGQKFPEALSCVLTYEENQTNVVAASGEGTDLAAMAEITNSSYVWLEGEGSLDRWVRFAVRVDNAFVRVFQATGWVITAVALFGYLLLLICTVLHREEFCGRLLLVATGILITVLVLLFGVLWFCSFLSMRKVYDYFCGGLILLDAWKCIGVWYVCHVIWRCAGRMRTKMGSRA